MPDQEAYEKYLAAYEQTLDAEYGEGTAQFVIETRSETSGTLRGITYTAEDKGWAITNALPNLHGDVAIASSVTRIADGAFQGCTSIEPVTLEQGSSIELGDRAFAGCTGIEAVYLLGGVPMWGDGVFEGCTALASPNHPWNLGIYSNLEYIGDGAFKNAFATPYETDITLAATLKRIGTGAFDGCTGLTSVTLQSAMPPALGSNAFTNMAEDF